MKKFRGVIDGIRQTVNSSKPDASIDIDEPLKADKFQFVKVSRFLSLHSPLCLNSLRLPSFFFSVYTTLYFAPCHSVFPLLFLLWTPKLEIQRIRFCNSFYLPIHYSPHSTNLCMFIRLKEMNVIHSVVSALTRKCKLGE